MSLINSLPSFKGEDGAAIQTQAGMNAFAAADLPYAPAKGEVRVTDPTTGGMKGKKLCQLGAIDPVALRALGDVAGYGDQKYERSNYLKGYAWSLNYDAMNRHMMAFWSGEQCDPESGLSHMAHAAWHALALVSFSTHHLGTDDRWIAPVVPAPHQNHGDETL